MSDPIDKLADGIDRALDNILGPNVPHRPGYNANNELTIEGMRLGVDGVLLSGPPDDNKQLNQRNFEAIKARRLAGFNVIDINPFLLDANNFGCQVPLSAIYSKIGYQGEQDVAAGSSAPQTNPWVTIDLPIPGSSLRIEYLPSEMNFGPASVSGASLQDYFKNIYYNPATGAGTLDDFYISDVILVQFEDGGAPLSLAKHNQNFKTDFTRVLITVKQGGPKFSVIIGTEKAVIDSGNDEKVNNQNLALGPGRGLWETANRHATPFCFGPLDQNPNNTQQTLLNGVATIKRLFTGSYASGSSTQNFIKGVATGWITSIDFSGFHNPTINSFQANIYLGIFRTLSATGTGGSLQKLLFHKNFLTGAEIAASGKQNRVDYTIQFQTPIRFTLDFNRDESLGFQVNNYSSGEIVFDWTICGYIYGIGSKTNSAVAFNWNMEAALNMPFPLDLNHRINNF